MTDMKRVTVSFTVSFPDDLDAAIIALRKTKQFERCSYSEIVRRLIERGLSTPPANRPGG